MTSFPAKATFLCELFEIAPEAYNGSYKKAWCKACCEAQVKVLLASDRAAVDHGKRERVRTLEDAQAHGMHND